MSPAIVKCWTVIHHVTHRAGHIAHHHFRRGIHHIAAHKAAATATTTLVCVVIGGGAFLRPPATDQLPPLSPPLIGPPIDFAAAGPNAFGPSFTISGEFGQLSPSPTEFIPTPTEFIPTLTPLLPTPEVIIAPPMPEVIPEPSTSLLFATLAAALAFTLHSLRRRPQ